MGRSKAWEGDRTTDPVKDARDFVICDSDIYIQCYGSSLQAEAGCVRQSPPTFLVNTHVAEEKENIWILEKKTIKIWGEEEWQKLTSVIIK